MLFFLLHIFKKHCDLLKPRRFVTFIIISLTICIMYYMGLLSVNYGFSVTGIAQMDGCSCLEKLMTLLSVNITSVLRCCVSSVIVVKLLVFIPDRGK